jgi:hypothetical protein
MAMNLAILHRWRQEGMPESVEPALMARME